MNQELNIRDCMRIYLTVRRKKTANEMYRERGRLVWDITLPEKDIGNPKTITVDVIGEKREFVIGGEPDEERI